LIVANHESLIDGLLLAVFLPVQATFVVHTTVARNPLNAWMLRFIPHLLVDSTSPLAMKIICKLVETGTPVVIFPEGRLTVTGSLMNYALPKADDVVTPELARTETPTPVNPLGVKGAGETGTIASTAAVANAVMDALSPFGIKHLDMPLTPGRIWEALRGKEA